MAIDGEVHFENNPPEVSFKQIALLSIAKVKSVEAIDTVEHYFRKKMVYFVLGGLLQDASNYATIRRRVTKLPNSTWNS